MTCVSKFSFNGDFYVVTKTRHTEEQHIIIFFFSKAITRYHKYSLNKLRWHISTVTATFKTSCKLINATRNKNYACTKSISFISTHLANVLDPLQTHTWIKTLNTTSFRNNTITSWSSMNVISTNIPPITSHLHGSAK